MSRLQGIYSYRSFCPVDGVGGNPIDLVPWTPTGELKVDTDASGIISGSLIFPPAIVLEIEGEIIPGEFRLFPKLPVPDGFKVTGKGLGAEYVVRGFFVDDSGCSVGTVTVLKGDLAHQPDGTSGPALLIQSDAGVRQTPQAYGWLGRLLGLFRKAEAPS